MSEQAMEDGLKQALAGLFLARYGFDPARVEFTGGKSPRGQWSPQVCVIPPDGSKLRADAFAAFANDHERAAVVLIDRLSRRVRDLLLGHIEYDDGDEWEGAEEFDRLVDGPRGTSDQ